MHMKGSTKWKASRGWAGGQVNFETASGVLSFESVLPRSQLGEQNFPSGILMYKSITTKRGVSRTFFSC